MSREPSRAYLSNAYGSLNDAIDFTNCRCKKFLIPFTWGEIFLLVLEQLLSLKLRIDLLNGPLTWVRACENKSYTIFGCFAVDF